MQITLGLPEPREFSSLPCLKLLQPGIQRRYREVRQGPKMRLPITPPILQRKNALASKVIRRGYYHVEGSGYNMLLWLLSVKLLSLASWGDMTIDNPQSPQVLAVHLKASKTDQPGKIVDVFISRTNTPVCAVLAVLAYMAVRGTAAGPLFHLQKWPPTNKVKI